MRSNRLVLGLAIAMLAAACSGGSDPSDDSSATDEESGSWTVLQYQMADTDLEPFMMEDVDEMGAVGSNDNLDIVALIDRSADYGDDPALDLGAWVGAKLVHIGDGTAEVLEEPGDVDLADPQTLADFISNGIEAYPADHYALVISDHGASWPGVGPDEGSEFDTLLLEEIKAGIESGLETAGVDKLDLLGFDACLMATYEVASAVAPLADRLIASSELEPGHGWDYAALGTVADDGATVDELGTALVDGFLAQAEEQGTDSDITLALLDLTKMGEVDDAMAEFTSALAERTDTVSPTVGRTLASNLGYGKSPDPAEDKFMTDLGALVGSIGVDALDVSDQADGVLQALNAAVLHKVSGPEAADFSGLAIYFPPSSEYFDPAYQDIPANSGGWDGFLSAYYGAGEAIPAEEQPAFSSDEATAAFDADGLTLSGVIELASANNVVDATIGYGIVEDDGSITFIGEEPASIADDGSGEVVGTYDLTALTITDGEDSALAYVSLTDDEEGGFTIDVPMAYYAPEDIDGETYQDALLSLTVDADGNVVQETYYAYDEASGSYGELTVDPEGIIVPEVLSYDADGNPVWTATSDVGLFADLPNLQYDFAPLPSGTTLYAELTATDYGGNVESVSTQVPVP